MIEPAPVAPVRLLGVMTPTGYQSENSAWKPFLTRPDKSLGKRADGTFRFAGLNPMKLSTALLEKAGHPQRKTEALVSALCNPSKKTAEYAEGDSIEVVERVKGYKDIPAYCDECSGDRLSRRKCAIINCPFWAYRMGKNPHSTRRGRFPEHLCKKSSISSPNGKLTEEGGQLCVD